jgi:hypothetical protein
MTSDHSITEISGTIACANERGVKLEGEAGWRNVSRFAPGVVIPAAGARVVLGLDKAGFIREVSTAAIAHSLRNSEAPLPSDSEGKQPADREARIVRMNAVSNAIAMLAVAPSGPLAVADVLAVAGQLEQWVCRG